MSDLIERLRNVENLYYESSCAYDYDAAETIDKAADKLERLTKVNAELLSALKTLIALEADDGKWAKGSPMDKAWKAARAAIKNAEEA